MERETLTVQTLSKQHSILCSFLRHVLLADPFIFDQPSKSRLIFPELAESEMLLSCFYTLVGLPGATCDDIAANSHDIPSSVGPRLYTFSPKERAERSRANATPEFPGPNV